MNYTKMAGQFVCKMAMPLALMFAACSTDNGNGVSKVEGIPGTEMGGSSDEPRIIASLMGRAYYAPDQENGNDRSSEGLGVSVPVNIFSQSGQVILRAVDSVTLEPVGDSSYTASFCVSQNQLTGETQDCSEFGGEGVARFTDIELNSPIVLLEAVSGEVLLKMVMDLRDSGTFMIDALSDLVVSRVKTLVESGQSFTVSKAQAEMEVANIFGFGGQNPFAEENLAGSSEIAVWRRAYNEVVPLGLLGLIKEEFNGSETRFSDNVKKSFVDRIEGSYMMNVLEISQSVFDGISEAFAAYYLECIQKKNYYAGLLAGVFGYGKCSAENEGLFADISGKTFELKCQSGSWNLIYLRTKGYDVVHTFGSMTDARDGNAYKTVTIELGETSQTWMAENLNYAVDGAECFKGKESYCSIYGRVYSLASFLDSSYIKYASVEDCVARKTVELMEYEQSSDTSYWAEIAREDYCGESFRENPENVDWNKVVDSLDVLNFNVCPEGWRMPKYEDWKSLFSYLRNRFDITSSGDVYTPRLEFELLLENYGNPTGFGMKLLWNVYGEPESYRLGMTGPGDYLFEPTVLSEDSRDPASVYAYADVFGSIVTTAFPRKEGFAYKSFRIGFNYGKPGVGFVRCIKAE